MHFFNSFIAESYLLLSLKLNRRRGFSCAIVEDAVDAFDFVDDTASGFLEDVPREAGAFGGHEVAGFYGAQDDGVVVGASVAHDADGAHVGEGGEVLAKIFGDACLINLFPIDGVGFLDEFYLFLRDLADDADAQPRPGERLALDKSFGYAELTADFADFVLKKKPERLDDFLEIDMIRQAADVVVRLDDGGHAQAALDDVGINGALDEEIDLPDLFRFRFKDANKFFADDFALLLGIDNAFQSVIKGFVSIDTNKIQIVGPFRAKDRRHFVAFIFAQKSVVDENAGKLPPDRLGKQHRRHRGIDAARKGAERPPHAKLRFQLGDRLIDEGAHSPISRAAADSSHKIPDHRLSFDGVQHFGMELDGIQPSDAVLHARYRAVRSRRRHPKARRRLGNVVRMAHPAGRFCGHPGKKPRIRHGDRQLGLTVFAGP